MSNPTEDDTGSTPCQFDQLSASMSDLSLHDIERHVRTAFKCIDKLGPVLASNALAVGESETDEQRWMKSLSELKAENTPSKVIIGVVGNTGAGKSSVINAILDEERIVPTNCFRACTAVITELSYNHSELPEERYRGEIEFVTLDDWRNELSHLKDDLLDSRGQLSKDASKADTDAGVAWAKIKAVYPKLTQEEFVYTDPENLMNEVREFLGTTKKVSASSVEAFYPQLQQYVDSTQGKSSKKGKRKKGEPKPEKKPEKNPEYWPMVKVVRVYTKARALSTGARIVDLPGVQDSNAARAAVADQYIQNCTGLWIVAPIARAVSDKTAQHLLGERFKLQVKYDNSYSAITFIASKADDISISEALRDFDLSEETEEVTELFDRFEELTEDLDTKTQELEELQPAFAAAQESLSEIQTKLDLWQKLAAQQEAGQTVFSPQSTPQKRFLRGSSPTPMRKRNTLESYYPVIRQPSKIYTVDSEESDDDSGSDSEDEVKPLTQEKLQSNLNDCKRSHVDALQLFEECQSHFLPVQEAHRALEEELSRLQPIIKAVCVRTRNDHSRRAIREDFARGIKELDQDSMNDADFDPEDDARDYDDVAVSLPVFCTSSFAYQTLSGRFRQDGTTPGFSNLQETEIPQLQDHAIFLTRAARSDTARRFLELFFQQLNSLSIWAVSKTTQDQLSASEKQAEAAHLQTVLGELRQDLDLLAGKIIIECKDSLKKSLFKGFDVSSAQAEAAAIAIAEGWSNKSTEGGMHFQTYRATCRREGAFSGSKGYRNLNEELLHPLKVSLAKAWDRSFTKVVPRALEKFSVDSREILGDFHSTYNTHMDSRLNALDMNLLQSQIQIRQQAFKDVTEVFKAKVETFQKDANRQFTPVIMRTLAQAYSDVRQETGLGSFIRMKEAMLRHVTVQKDSMFQASCRNVQSSILRLCNEMKQEMTSKIDETVDTMSADYLQTIMGREVSPASKIVRSNLQRLLSQVHHSLESGQVDPSFDEVVPIKEEDNLVEGIKIKEENNPVEGIHIKQEHNST
ncbi:hypothetical protein KJ359_005245 [Pestalotiopsis sp. 9143b]|nr:hypothetical protein KJ359_005245 [Pestalotiopsis sp. 9143b]